MFFLVPRAKRLALFLFVLLATICLLEGVSVWMLGASFQRGVWVGSNWSVVAEPDPLLGWKHRKNARGRVLGKHFEYEVSTNSLGFRDRARTVHKSAGVRRVVVLGDSVAWGWGIDADQRFSDRLEARLGPSVEVFNLAVPAYGTDQQWLTLERSGSDLDPDVVVVCMVLNDILECEREEYVLSKPRFVRTEDRGWSLQRPGPLSRGQRWSRAKQRCWDGLFAYSATATLLVARDLRGAPTQDPQDRVYAAPSREYVQQVEQVAQQLSLETSAARYSLEQIAAFCSLHQAQLIVVPVAFNHDQYLYEPNYPLPPGLNPKGFQSVFTREVQRAAERVGAHFVSVDERMWQVCRSGTRLHVGDGHPNAEGHRWIAAELEPLLRELLQLEETSLARTPPESN